MIPPITGILGFIILFSLLFMGLPIGVGMAIVGFAGFWFLGGISAAFATLTVVPYDIASSYDFAVLPLFILMAEIASIAGITKGMYELAAKWLGHRPGGLALATIAGCAGFSAVSSSSIATAATMGMVAIPEMKKYKYDNALITGSLAAGGTMGILIPPSGVMIIYGIMTGSSIGKLFIGGILPGILMVLFYFTNISILCHLKPHLGPRGPRSTLKEKLAAFKICGDVLALIVLVIGGLMIGLFTPTESGAIGAFGAIVLAIIRRKLDWAKFTNAVLSTLKTTGMIYFIMIGAMILNRFLAISNLPYMLTNFVAGLSMPPLAIMGMMILVYFLLGSILDAAAMVLLTLPIFFPLAVSLGFNEIWFGLIIVRVVEIAMITPPIGMNVFIISGIASDVPMETVFKGILWFLVSDILHLTLLVFVPGIVLFLPGIFG